MSLGKVDGFVDPSNRFSALDPALNVNLDSLVEIMQVIISKILRTLLNFIKKDLINNNHVPASLYPNLEHIIFMNRAVIIGIIIAVVIGVTVASASFYFGDKTENSSIETEITPESEPKQFSVELREGLGVSDEP